MDYKEDKKEKKSNIVMGFWNDLAPCAKILAPMADVTDLATRRIIAKYSRMGEVGGGPDLLYTEFVAADGIFSEEGRKKLLPLLDFDKKYRPIVAQIFSSNPEKMEYAAKLCVDLGFDGIDLNMGCPDKNINKQGAGAAMIRTPDLAREIIYAAKRGVQGAIPVSVKTRIGWSKNEIETWIPQLLETDIAAIILHGRTRNEMSKVPANWDAINRAGEIVRASGKQTKFIGNGDITSLAQANEYCKKYQVDGVMIGRGIFGKPWFFDSQRKEIGIRKRLEIMLEHTKLFEDFVKHKSFHIMKKHYKAYVQGFDGAKDLRMALMETKNYEEAYRVVNDFLDEHPYLK